MLAKEQKRTKKDNTTLLGGRALKIWLSLITKYNFQMILKHPIPHFLWYCIVFCLKNRFVEDYYSNFSGST